MNLLQRREAASLAESKKIIAFGAGRIAELTLGLLNVPFCFLVDSDSKKQGDLFLNQYEIFSPEKLRDLSSEFVVVVCSEYYEEILPSLKKLNPKLDVYISPILKNHFLFKKLDQPGERLLVSGYGRDGGVFLIEPNNRECRRLLTGSFRGLDKAGEKIFAVDDGGDIFEITSLDQGTCEKRFESSKNSQSHGLGYLETEKVLLVAEPRFDRISFISLENFEVVKHHSIKMADNHKEDNHHINDMHIDGSDIYYSLISLSGDWKNGVFDGAIVKLNLDSLESPTVLWKDLHYPHSVAFYRESLIVLEALRGKLIADDKRTLGAYTGFLRGLAVGQEVIYIGQSRNRRIDLLEDSEQMISIDSGIHILDPETKLTRFVQMPDYCDVYDILII